MIRNALTLVSALAALTTQAQTVFTSRTVNLDPSAAQSVTALCSRSYEKASGQVVTQGEGGQGETVSLTVVGLGTPARPGNIIVNAERKTSDGHLISTAELAAESMDDIPTTCDRVAEAIFKKVDVSATRDRHNITAHEAHASAEPVRLGTEKLLGVKTSLSAALGGYGIGSVGSVMFDGRFERDRFFFEFGGGFLLPGKFSTSSSYGGLVAELGADYYLTDTEHALYAGLGVQPRINFGGSSIFTIVPYAQLGMMFARSSSTRVYADVRVAQNILAVTTSGFSPTELGLEVGIGF